MNKNCKFYANLVLEAKGIKEQRAHIMTRNTMRSQAAIIQGIQKRLDDIDEKELNLTDLSPENTYSLKPGGNNFTSQAWTEELQGLGIRRREVQVEMDVAMENFEKWFGKKYVDGLLEDEEEPDKKS